MKAKVGTRVFFSWNDDEYERDIESITIYKNYSWIGDLGFGGDVMFIIHGDLDENNEPVMSGLSIQVDGVGNSTHEYVRDGVTFEA